MGEISSKVIIDELFNYVKDKFDKFGHQEPDWWWNTADFGGSWSPFVETCFILYGEKIYESNPRDHIRHNYTKPNIQWFMDKIHVKIYNKDTKYEKGKSDINFIDNGNFILSLEHSEDGTPIRKQKDNITEEIDKLKRIPDGFKVLISRPQPFDRWINREGYSQSIGYFKQKIQNKLKDDNGKWLIILIAPSPDINPTEIIFHCYEWNGTELLDLDPNHTKYVLPIKVKNGKWEKQ